MAKYRTTLSLPEKLKPIVEECEPTFSGVVVAALVAYLDLDPITFQRRSSAKGGQRKPAPQQKPRLRRNLNAREQEIWQAHYFEMVDRGVDPLEASVATWEKFRDGFPE